MSDIEGKSLFDLLDEDCPLFNVGQSFNASQLGNSEAFYSTPTMTFESANLSEPFDGVVLKNAESLPQIQHGSNDEGQGSKDSQATNPVHEWAKNRQNPETAIESTSSRKTRPAISLNPMYGKTVLTMDDASGSVFT